MGFALGMLAGARRCNMKSVEECNGAGTTWTTVDTRAGTCSSGRCALANLDVTMNRNLDGTITSMATSLSARESRSKSQRGTHRLCQNITVENAGTISAAPTSNPYGWGDGSRGMYDYSGGGGGGNGTAGQTYPGAGAGGPAISNTDYWVVGGGRALRRPEPAAGWRYRRWCDSTHRPENITIAGFFDREWQWQARVTPPPMAAAVAVAPAAASCWQPRER